MKMMSRSSAVLTAIALSAASAVAQPSPSQTAGQTAGQAAGETSLPRKRTFMKVTKSVIELGTPWKPVSQQPKAFRPGKRYTLAEFQGILKNLNAVPVEKAIQDLRAKGKKRKRVRDAFLAQLPDRPGMFQALADVDETGETAETENPADYGMCWCVGTIAQNWVCPAPIDEPSEPGSENRQFSCKSIRNAVSTVLSGKARYGVYWERDFDYALKFNCSSNAQCQKMCDDVAAHDAQGDQLDFENCWLIWDEYQTQGNCDNY